MKKFAAWSLAVLAAADCLGVALFFGTTQLEPGQPVWTLFPLPGLYLLEIALIGLLAPAAMWKASSKWFSALPAAAGITLAFFILGGFSIGPFLLPALLGLVALAMLTAKDYGVRFPIAAALFFGAAIGQAGIMLLLVAIHTS